MMRLTVRYFFWRQASLFFCCRPWPKVTMTVALYVSVSKVFVFPLIAWFLFETITELSWVVWLWWKGWFHFNKGVKLYVRDRPLKASADFPKFWPLPPSRRQFFTTIRRQIWQTFDPSRPKKCWRLKWMVPIERRKEKKRWNTFL